MKALSVLVLGAFLTVAAGVCLDCSGPNEYYDCGKACDNVCSKLQYESQDNCPIINIRCNDKCYCRKGYARDDKNICIPISQCPPNCPFPNEHYVKNKPKCPRDLCSAPLERCIPALSGCPGCVCDTGYLRPAAGKPCIPQCECSQLKNTSYCNH